MEYRQISEEFKIQDLTLGSLTPLISSDQPNQSSALPPLIIIFQNYRIMYLVKADYLYIVAVIHGSRDLTRMDNKPWEVV